MTRLADRLVAAGLVLTALPGFGYLVAWTQQYGYEQHFRVPVALIAPQLGTVLATTVVLALALLCIFVLVEAYVSSRHPQRPGPIESRVLLLGGLTISLGLASILAASFGIYLGPYPIPTFVALVLFACLAAFAPGLRGHPRSFRDRLARADATRPPDPPSVLSAALISRIGRGFFFLGPAIFLILVGAYDFGSYQAQTQTDYLVSDTPLPEVVVAMYGDTVILAPYDNSEHVVRPEFDIVKIGGQSLHLRWVTVGPLGRS
jgi:hypothetical protein